MRRISQKDLERIILTIHRKNYPDNSYFASRNKGLHILDNRFDDTHYPFGFEPTLHAYRLNDYIGKKGRNIFVCSMADLFGVWVPHEWIEAVFEACEKAPQHNYLFLTKNPVHYEFLYHHGFLRKRDNMWYGYSKPADGGDFWHDSQYNTFVSIEPILEPVDVPFVNWVIVGAETGKRKDKVVPKKEWIERIVEQCSELNIPLFMKSSLADIWGKPLIQEFSEGLKRYKSYEIGENQ